MEKEITPSTIKNFLDRFRKLAPPHKKIKDFLVLFLMSQYGITVDLRHIRMVHNHIYIRTTPIRKTEILKNKQNIIQVIQKEFSITGIDIS